MAIGIVDPFNSPRDDNVAAKESGELDKFRLRGYARVGEVNILTNYSSVKKGEEKWWYTMEHIRV